MEESEFERLFAPIDDLLLNVIARKVKNREMAIEIYHEVILLGMVNFHQLRDEARFPAWIFTIARNTIHSRFKKDMRRQEKESVMDFDNPANEGVLFHASVGFEDAVIARDEMRRLREAIASLGATEQAIIAMFFNERMPLSDIAEELGMKLSAVKGCKRRALKKIKEILEK